MMKINFMSLSLLRNTFMTGKMALIFSLLFGPEISARLLEKWHTSYKGEVIREAECLTSTPVLQSLLMSAKNQYSDKSSEDHPGIRLQLNYFKCIGSTQKACRSQFQKWAFCWAWTFLFLQDGTVMWHLSYCCWISCHLSPWKRHHWRSVHPRLWNRYVLGHRRCFK